MSFLARNGASCVYMRGRRVADGKCEVAIPTHLDADARKAKCDTIGGTVTPLTCKYAVDVGCVTIGAHHIHAWLISFPDVSSTVCHTNGRGVRPHSCCRHI